MKRSKPSSVGRTDFSTASTLFNLAWSKFAALMIAASWFKIDFSFVSTFFNFAASKCLTFYKQAKFTFAVPIQYTHLHAEGVAASRSLDCLDWLEVFFLKAGDVKWHFLTGNVFEVKLVSVQMRLFCVTFI